MRFYHLVVIFISGCLMSFSTAYALPVAFSADYKGSKYLFGKARATITLSRQGNYYLYTMRSNIRFLWYRNKVFDCSVMQIVNNTLRPLEHLHYESYDDKYNIKTRFDWEQGVANADFLGRGQKVTLNIEGDAWDTMSIQVKLMHDVMNQQLNAGDKYQVVQLGKMLDWNIAAVNNVTSQINGKSLSAVSVKADFKDESTTLWFSSQHHFLPVQMLVNDVLVEIVSDPDSAQVQTPEHALHSEVVPSCKV